MAFPEQGVRVIQGEVLRVEGENYLVKAQDGREIRFRADTTTMRSLYCQPRKRSWERLGPWREWDAEIVEKITSREYTG